MEPPPREIGVERQGLPTPFSIVVDAVFFGVLGGSLELIVFWLRCFYFDPRNANVSRHFPWMFLAAGLLTSGLCGLLLVVASKVRPGKVSSWLVFLVLGFPPFLGVVFRLPISTIACVLLAAGISSRVASWLARRAEVFDRLARRGVIGSGLAAVLIGTISAGSSRVEERRTGSDLTTRPVGLKNVLLIVLDTVRADALEFSGDPNGPTPNLARHAARGTRFRHAYSTAPWTAPAHASMFTGFLPHELEIGWNTPLEKGRATLAERLASQGFKTAGFVANTTYCSYETGLDRGFEHYEDYDVNLGTILLCSSITQRVLNFIHQHPRIEEKLPSLNFGKSTRKDAARIRSDFLRWRSEQDREPFFAFLNLFDAHHPYLSPEAEEVSPRDQRILKTWWDRDKRALKPRDLEMARASYGECIRYLDQEVGRLLDELDRQGVLKETLVVITADHGEHLGERGLHGHGCSLYAPELHVPLIVIGEGAAPPGLVIESPVSLRDLPSTIVDVLGFKDLDKFPGRSLAETWSSRAPSRREAVFSEIEAPPEVDPNFGTSPVQKGPMRSLIVEGFHYIRNGDGREELYAIDFDPLEERDLATAPEFERRLVQFRGRLRVDSRGTRLESRGGL